MPHFEPPERIPERHRTVTRDMSEAPSEASQPDPGLEIPRTVNAITTSLPPMTPRKSRTPRTSRTSGPQTPRTPGLRTSPASRSSRTITALLTGELRDWYLDTNSKMRHVLASYYLCTLNGVATDAVVSSVFCDAIDGLYDAQLAKANDMKDQWKHHSIKNMRAFINYCLDETWEGNVPSQSAQTFLTATSRRLVRPLLRSAFSIDRFEDVFKFVDDYLDLGLSTDRVRNWCEFIWQDIGVLILLTELKERNIPIVVHMFGKPKVVVVGDDDGNITFLELGEQNKDADILPDD
ncbi:hypothetical protein E4U51_003407 [Claviceps purpurea]|nr:hypothetical protein E4U51_003407 [Claviceps purpurea]